MFGRLLRNLLSYFTKILKIWIFQNMIFIYLNFPQNLAFSNIMVKVYNKNTALARWEYQNWKNVLFKYCSHQSSIFLEISSYCTEEISNFHLYYTAYLAKSIWCILFSSLVSKRVCWLLLRVKSSSIWILSSYVTFTIFWKFSGSSWLLSW